MDGVDDDRRHPAAERHHHSLVATVVVENVEALSLEGAIDPSQVGCLAGSLIRSAEVATPGCVGQSRHAGGRAGGPERRDVVPHPAKLILEEMDHQFGSTVAARR